MTGLKVLKDLNYVDFKESLDLTASIRSRLRETIEKDANFLSRKNLMDYSLLLIKAKVCNPEANNNAGLSN
jgi:hypothetical protein